MTTKAQGETLLYITTTWRAGEKKKLNFPSKGPRGLLLRAMKRSRPGIKPYFPEVIMHEVRWWWCCGEAHNLCDGLGVAEAMLSPQGHIPATYCPEA